MHRSIIVRPETAGDVEAIAGVSAAAFSTPAISRHTEQFVIEALRAAGVLTLSLVAQLDGRVVWHIAFSPVSMSDGSTDWYGLGPVSVLPRYQRQGIGQALIRDGLARLRAPGRARRLPGRFSGLLSPLRLRAPARAGARGHAGRSVRHAVVRRAHPTGHGHLARRIQRGRSWFPSMTGCCSSARRC